MNRIDSIDAPEIASYRNLKQINIIHNENNLFIAEGEKVVRRLLQSELEIVSLFALEEYYEKYADLIGTKNIPDSNKFFADKDFMNQIVGFKVHSGIMALAVQPALNDLNELSSPVIILNGIINSENVGSIIRNCAGFGINSIIYDSETSSPYLRRAVRVSIGSIFNMKLHYSIDLSTTIKDLKDLGYRVIALELARDAISINDYKFPAQYAIILGNEGNGIDNKTLNECDDIVFIPITDNIDSLNVAASSAILFFFLNNLRKI